MIVGVGVLDTTQFAVASAPENGAPSVAVNAAFACEAKTIAISREARVKPPARRIRPFPVRNTFGTFLRWLPFYGRWPMSL